ncbi:MAG: hypothetical protein QMC97_10895 [Pseudothermotoga sp.]|nr:hypothetical protein [Pseudothermotoga sp.]MBC7123573.1 hypothetical protein [Pseudothermotoga sp.]MDI6863873.1 hypothetical protein [Pseudothermotoga sp.]
MLRIAYIAMLIYFSVVLVKLVFKKPGNWNWLMASMVITPWILRIMLIK